MDLHVESLCPLLVENNTFCQNTDVTNEELPCEYGSELLSGLLRSVEIDGLQRDLTELIHILHVAERPSVRGYVLCVFASKDSHYITTGKSQQYTYHANNTNKMYRST